MSIAAHGLRRLPLLLPAALLAALGCGDDQPVKIGAVLPLSGPDSLYGNQVRAGVDLAYERVKADPGAPKIEVVTRDSGSDAGRAKKELEALFNDGAQAVVGGVTSKEALQMVDVADQFDRPLLSPSASSPELTGISKNFFRVFPSDFLEGSKMGNFATQTLKLSTVVILAAESLYGRGSQEVFKNEFERYGGKVLEVLEYPEGTRDYSGLMGRVLTLNPQSVYLADFAAGIGTMVRGLRDRGFKGRLLTTSAFASPQVLDQVGEAAEGVLLTQPVFDLESKNPLVKEFVDAYRKKYREDPGLYAAHGYDAVMVLVESLKAASLPSSGEILKGLRQLSNFQGVTGVIQFDERGDVKKYPRIYIVKDGRLIDYESWAEAERERIRKELERIRREARQSSPGGT
jgi:branched-chain amino acid transport system substrate-binding protein